jgi:hypothetical protein
MKPQMLTLAALPSSADKRHRKKKTRKPADKTQSLSDWLTTQQNEGRRG